MIFRFLKQQVNGKPLVYSRQCGNRAKTSECVIKKLDHYYREYNANIHRGVHKLSELATEEYEQVRTKLSTILFNANSTKEIIFVRGATEGINLVAQSFGKQ